MGFIAAQGELNREKKAGLTTAASDAFTSTSYQYVQKKIAALGFQDMVIPIKGYFQDSLPKIPGSFCLALIDCDLKDCAPTVQSQAFDR